ncbi:MAG TPA: hypothetical protein VIE86_00605 [Nitrososphaera sp.]|jgi:hypothetical protein
MMLGQDPAPLPYGALPYFQVHYIVQVESDENASFLAKCEPITRGHFGNKRVIDVRWTGLDGFANDLQSDSELTEMLKKAMLRVGEIRVDPQDDNIRIYGKWTHEDRSSYDGTMLEIADRIAMHIRQKLRRLGVQA